MSKQKEKTSDCYCLFKGVFGLHFDQKLPRKDSDNHKSFLLFTRCELLRLKAITFVIWRVVSRHTSWTQLNAEILDYACCDLLFCDGKSGTSPKTIRQI